MSYVVSGLTVDCRKRPYVDSKQLSNQIDSILSSNLTHGHLTSLSIINSPLTHVPRSVCRLTTLTHLYLDNNRLSQLPDNCLSNLSNLVRFSAYNNAIDRLQDGVFDGLTKLQHLNLTSNVISSIGLSVFAMSSNLSNLLEINMSVNNLTSLEPWVIVRGFIGSLQRIVHIDLSLNKISKFTNKMRLHKICSRKIPFVYINLEFNEIRHFLDIVKGWEVNSEDALDCYRISGGRINFQLQYYGNYIVCDCVDFYFFSVSAFKEIQYYYQPIKCHLIDPLTKRSKLVGGFQTPLELFVCELTERCPAGCICVHRPANATLHVYCSDTNLTILPLQLPKLPDKQTRYKLDFSSNQLLRLEHRDYFANTSILDVSNCGVVSVSDWKEIATIPEVNLYGNDITILPSSLLSVNITTEKLNIADNPWDCSCDNKWMSGWLTSIADQLTENVRCYSPDRLRGKSIDQVSSEEFCVDPATKAASEAAAKAASAAVNTALIKSMSSVVGVVVLLLSVGVIVYRLRVKLYTKWKFHPFDRDECLGEDMDYDVFVSCSSDDNLPHGNRIRELLEQQGYRVCYPPRDFIAGDSISDNIYNAVVRSKRTVCLLTSNFIQR